MTSEHPDASPSPILEEEHVTQLQGDHVTQRDVVVIGAGWSGLAACKYMLEEGLSVVLLEKRNNIGGVWLYDDNPEIPTVMKSTQSTSSSTVLEFSDYPMPEDIGVFPHHTDVLEYLRSYAREFQLTPHIRLNSNVEKVDRIGKGRDARGRSGGTTEEEGGWITTCSNGEAYKSKFLVAATGIAEQPNRELEESTLKGFTGPIHHASEIKSPLEDFKGKRLLVVGGGETGSDICIDWYKHAKSIHWSIPRGQHFFRKYAKVVPWGKRQALDKASSRMMKTIAPYHQSKPGLAWVCKWTTNGSLIAYQGHGIPEWKNDAEFFKFFINKNGRVLDLVDYKKLIPKAGIAECNGQCVTFKDGTQQDFDLIIMSTGYNVLFPFLPRKYAAIGIRQRHKMIFDVDDPTLAVVGQVRPVVGSIVGISELQARWAAKVFSHKIPLQPLEERRREVEEDEAYWSKYFKNSSQRIEGLVEGFTYIDDVAHHAGIYPDYWSLFKRSPRQWMVAYFSPYNGATFRLNESDKLEKSIKTMRHHQKATLGPLQYLLIALLRLVWFDWWLTKASDIKYWIQTRSWWPMVRDWKLVRIINWMWTCPKRFLFDASSDDRDAMSAQARLFLDENTRTVTTTHCNGNYGNGIHHHPATASLPPRTMSHSDNHHPVLTHRPANRTK